MSSSETGFFDSLLKFINAVTGLVAAVAASGVLLWLTGLPAEHYDSRSAWRCHAGEERNWRSRDFNDREWAFAISPAPHKAGVPIGEDKFPTMWISPDSTEATFRLTFNVPSLAFIREATLLTISDDDHEARLNGLAIVYDENHSAGPLVTTDLRRVLREGKNVLAIHAWDHIPAKDQGKPKASRWMAVDLRIRNGLPGS